MAIQLPTGFGAQFQDPNDVTRNLLAQRQMALLDQQIQRGQVEDAEAARKREELRAAEVAMFDDPSPQNTLRYAMLNPQAYSMAQDAFKGFSSDRIQRELNTLTEFYDLAMADADKESQRVEGYQSGQMAGRGLPAYEQTPVESMAERRMIELRDKIVNSGQYDQAQIDLLDTAIDAKGKDRLWVLGNVIGMMPGGKKYLEQKAAEQAAREAAAEKLGLTRAEAGLKTAQTMKAVAEARAEPEKLALQAEDNRIKREQLLQQAMQSAEGRAIDRERIAVERQRLLQSASELPPNVFSAVQGKVDAASGNAQAASAANDLASRLESSGGDTGRQSLGKMWSWLGFEPTEVQKLRDEYASQRSRIILQRIPPGLGAMSNSDRDFFEKGFPPDSANVDYLAKFMRAQARVLRASEMSNQLEAEWLTENKTSGPARKEFYVSGYRVMPGVSFRDFLADVAKDQKKQSAAPRQQAGSTPAKTTGATGYSPTKLPDFIGAYVNR